LNTKNAYALKSNGITVKITVTACTHASLPGTAKIACNVHNLMKKYCKNLQEDLPQRPTWIAHSEIQTAFVVKHGYQSK